MVTSHDYDYDIGDFLKEKWKYPVPLFYSKLFIDKQQQYLKV